MSEYIIDTSTVPTVQLSNEIEDYERTCNDNGVGVFRCSRCGVFVTHGSVMDCVSAIPIRHCPNCGRKVVEGSKKVVETVTCDVCGNELGEDGFSLTIPIRWLTEQTEGKFCKPYYQAATIDICEKCANDALRIEAVGAQGCRKYKITRM